MRAIFSFFLLALLSSQCVYADTLTVWKRNYDAPFFKESLENLLTLSAEKYGDVTLVPSEEMEQGRAFIELQAGKIDIFIAGINQQREQKAKPIYIPLDRGLLGFRVCMVREEESRLTDIRSVNEFLDKQLTVGLGEEWPDLRVYNENGFVTVTSPTYSNLFIMLQNKRFDCFSRSLNEIDNELSVLQESDLKIDSNLVFIYPNADFIYVNNNSQLSDRLYYGMQKAIENDSYYELFDRYFYDVMLRHDIYRRQLVIMHNSDMSNAAADAINRYGIAGFTQPTK